MNDKQQETDKELDCQVTVNDGAYMTCDMIEDESPEDETTAEDYDI